MHEHACNALSSDAILLPKAVLFDLDGTLVDTIDDILFAINESLRSFSLPEVDRGTCLAHVGRGLVRALQGILQAVGAGSLMTDDRSFSLLHARMLSVYREHPCERSAAYAGVPDLLQACVAANLPLGVLSNKDDDLVVQIVNRLFPHVPFALVRGVRNGFPLKPDPSSGNEFARIVGLPFHEILYVGDSEVDAMFADAAGMQCAVVTWGFRSKDELAAAGHGPLHDTVAELGRRIGAWA